MHPDRCRWRSKWLIGVRDILQRVCGCWTGGQSAVIRRCLTQEQDSNSNCGLAKEEGKDRVLDQLKLWHYELANPNFVSNPLFLCPPLPGKAKYPLSQASLQLQGVRACDTVLVYEM